MFEFFFKIVEEAISAQRAEMEILRAKRRRRFVTDDAIPYVDAVNKMRAINGQSSSVVGLYVDSVNAHFKALRDLTRTIQPEDEPCLGRLQTPAVLEILYREDDGFKKSVEIFIDMLKRSRKLIGQELVKRYGRPSGLGRWQGSKNQALQSRALAQAVRSAKIPAEHRLAILAASYWLLDNSCGVGHIFFREVEAGAGLEQAQDAEILWVKRIFDQPAQAQVDISESLNHLSFDANKYIASYSNAVENAVKKAMNDGVHYANILNISAFSVEGMSTISQSSLGLVEDDLTMAVLEAVVGVMEASLIGSADRFKVPDNPLVLATGSVGCALEYILEMDGFTALDLISLLRRRSPLHQLQYPFSGGASGFYHLDFVDLIYNGWRYLDNTSRKGKACTGRGLPVPKVTWFDVDLNPMLDNEILMNPQRYSNPASPISARLSALMRLSDQPRLFNGAAISVIMANVLSTQKGKVLYPADIYSNYVMGRLKDSNIDYCQYA